VNGGLRFDHLTSGVSVARASSPHEYEAGKREQGGDRETPRRPLGRLRGRSLPGRRFGRGHIGRRHRRHADMWAYRRPGFGPRLVWTLASPCPAARRGRHGSGADAPRPLSPLPNAGLRSHSGSRRRLARDRPRTPPAKRERGRSRRRGRGRLTLAHRRRRSGGRRDRRRLHGHRSRRTDRRRRCGRRRRHLGRRTLRQERQRVDVALRVIRSPDAEMNVRHLVLRIAGRADRADCLALGNSVAGRDHDRAQVEERDRVAVLRPDRHGPAVGRQPACK
jgi:hypothetical protein